MQKSLIDDWQQALVSSVRLPRGARAGLSQGELLEAAIRQEAKVVKEIWKVYTQERGRLAKGFLGSQAFVAAYLAGFHLPNAARMTFLLERLAARTGFARESWSGPVTINDWGAGTGAMAQAWAHWAKVREEDALHLTDASGPLLDGARKVLGSLAGLATHRLDLAELPVARFKPKSRDTLSVYLMGYTLNEIGRNPRAGQAIGKILRGHAERDEPALALILEPANQTLCRNAMTLRDELCAEGYVPLYPCPAAFACPMLARPRDWCYSEFPWKPLPRPIKLLDRLTGLDHGTLPATAFALATQALAQRLTLPGPLQVVVGRPTKTHGSGFDYLLCTPEGLRTAKPPKGAPVLERGLPFNA